MAIALEGDFAAAHTDGDNTMVVATDTMKNTAYAFAQEHLDGAIEAYGAALGRHFLEDPQVDRATVNVRGHHWQPDRRRRHARARRVRPRRRGDARRDGRRDPRRHDASRPGSRTSSS